MFRSLRHIVNARTQHIMPRLAQVKPLDHVVMIQAGLHANTIVNVHSNPPPLHENAIPKMVMPITEMINPTTSTTNSTIFLIMSHLHSLPPTPPGADPRVLAPAPVAHGTAKPVKHTPGVHSRRHPVDPGNPKQPRPTLQHLIRIMHSNQPFPCNSAGINTPPQNRALMSELSTGYQLPLSYSPLYILTYYITILYYTRTYP